MKVYSTLYIYILKSTINLILLEVLILKNKNNLFLILGVALVAVVLGSVITASVTGLIVFPNQRVQNAPTIKANSCDADSSCEVGQITTTRGTNLLITSANKYIRMMNRVSIKQHLILPEIQFQNPGENGEIGDPTSGDPRIFVEKSLASYGVVSTLKEGSSTTILDANGDNGKLVKLEAVGSKNAVVSVEGVSKVISSGDSQLVNGLGVTVRSVLAKSNKGLSSAGESFAVLVLNYNPEYIKTLVIEGVSNEAASSYAQVRIGGKLYATSAIKTNSLTVEDLGRIKPDQTTDNAFVCVNKDGFLYRSSTACV